MFSQVHFLKKKNLSFLALKKIPPIDSKRYASVHNMRSSGYAHGGTSPLPHDPSSRSSTIADYNTSHSVHPATQPTAANRVTSNNNGASPSVVVGSRREYHYHQHQEYQYNSNEGSARATSGGIASMRVHPELVSQITTGPLFANSSQAHHTPSSHGVGVGDSPESPSALRSAARSRYDPSTTNASVDPTSFVLGDGSSFLPERSYSRIEPATPLSAVRGSAGGGQQHQSYPDPSHHSYRRGQQQRREESTTDDDYLLNDLRQSNHRHRGGGGYHDEAPVGRNAQLVDEEDAFRRGGRNHNVATKRPIQYNDPEDRQQQQRRAPPTTATAGRVKSPRAPSLEQLGHEQLHTRCLMLASCLEHTTTERDALSEMIGNLTSYRDTLLQDIFVLRETNKEVTTGKEKADAAVVELTEELRQCASLVDSLREAKQRGDDTAQHTSLSLDVLQRSNRVLESDRDQLSAEVASLRAKHAQDEHQIATLSRQLKDALEQVERLELEVQEAKIIETQMEKMVVERDEEVDRGREQHTSVSRERSAFERQLQDALERETGMQRTIERLTKAHEELRSDMRKVMAQGQQDAEVARELKSEVAVLKAREAEWINTREALEVQRGTAQGSSEQLVQRCQELREQVARLEVKLETAQDQNSKLQASEAELRTKNSFAEERSIALREASDTEKRLRDDLDNRVAEAEAAVARCEEELVALREELLATKQALVNTSETLDSTRRELDSSKISAAAEDAHREELVTVHEAKLRETEHAKGAIHVQYEQLEGTLKLVQEFHAHLISTTSVAMSQRDYAHKRLETLEEQAKAVKEQLDAEYEAKAQLSNELHQSREAQSVLHQRLEQLEHVLEQTNDMLSATRQDRDLLVNEMRRSQQLWMNMSDQQAMQRTQRNSGTLNSAAPANSTTAITAGAGRTHISPPGQYHQQLSHQQQQPQLQYDDDVCDHRTHVPQGNNSSSNNTTPMSPVITGVVAHTS